MSPVSIMQRMVRRARYLASRRDAERDMNDEMRAHLEFEIDDRIKRGIPPTEARRSALAAFGGVERFKEEARDARGVRPLEDVMQDARYAVRVLRKSKLFTIACTATVAIGIAATTSVFSVVNAVLFRPPPLAQPNRLFVVTETWKSGQHSFQTDIATHMYRFAHYLELRASTLPALSGLAGYRYGNVALRTESEVRPVSSMAVTSNYFAVLGIQPALGQLFTDTAEHSGLPLPEAVISHDLWQGEFAGNANVIGRTLFVDSKAVTVVGVAAAGFTGTIAGLAADVWLPTNGGSITMIGRLAQGITRQQAEHSLTNIAAPLPAFDPDPLHKVVRVALDPITGPPAMMRGEVVGFLGMLLLMATMVLPIVAANIAGMFLARAAHRRREIAVRLAMGASRGRVIRQLLTESTLLTLAGGAVGVLLAVWLLSLIPMIKLPIGARMLINLQVDARVLAVALGVTLLAGIVAGLTPALQSARVDLLSALRGSQYGLLRPSTRSRSAFVVAQLAFSLILLTTAGLFARALQRAVNTDTGLDAKGVDVAEINISAHGYNNDSGRQMYATLLARLEARPEIAAVAFAQWTPLNVGSNSEEFVLPNGRRERTTWGVADKNYFRTLGIPLVAGRNFTDGDTKDSPPVVVVNETLAKRLWPGQLAIGQELKLDGTRTVVGVIRDGKYRGLDESPGSYAMLPLSQRHALRIAIHIRARGDRAAALAALRAELAAVNPNVALEKVGELSSQLDLYYLPQKIAALCIGLFGAMGLALALLGIYGVVAYSVAQRTHEFGVRIALGASRRDIVQAVLKPGYKVIGVSIAIGVPVAMLVARFAKSLLYGVGTADPLTFVVIPVALGAVAIIASYVPARRAGRVDPMVSLRVE